MRQTMFFIAAILVVLGTVLTARAQECPVESYDTSPECAKAITGCICVYSLMATESNLPNCGGCRIFVNGTRDCNLPNGAGDKTYVDVAVIASCHGGGFKLDDCPCTGFNVELASVLCSDCPS